MERQSRIVKQSATALTCVIAGYLLVANGIIGYHVYRWEAILWSLILLAWVDVAATNARIIRRWQHLARYQQETLDGQKTHPLIVVKPEEE